MKGPIAAGLIFVLLLSGCTLFQPQKEETAQELASKGMAEFNSVDYRAAINYFQKLRDWYPFSKLAILAELKIADSFFRLLRYDEAIAAYGQFERLHPRNEATPYVINQIGLSYFGQVDTIDRDQGAAKRALDTFLRLTKQFPDSIYAQKAKENIVECQRSLAGHALEIGLFYYKSKHYEAAIDRFESVLKNYPDVGRLHYQALQFIALSKEALNGGRQDDKLGQEID